MAGPIRKDLYHGAGPLDQLDPGTIDPIKHSSSRTPLPAFTMGEKNVAERYAKSGGVGRVRSFSGPLYKMGLEFDAPERIVGAFDLAGNDFINFMRETLPESGLAPPVVPGGSQRTVNFRNIFDEFLTHLKPEDKTVYGIMDTIGNVHDKYRPLGEYDYLPRGQGSIEARRFGIDALTWNDHGDEVLGLLDPDDIRSNVGRKNIKSIQEIDYGSSAAPVAPTAPQPSADIITTSHPRSAPKLDDTVTAAGRNRPMVAANFTAMSDEDLLKHYDQVKKTYEEQLIKDPDGKAFLPTAKSSLEGTEKQLKKRGIHPGSNVQPSRSGPGNIGRSADDIRTRPAPKGSDAASARVTDSGAGRPVVDIPTAPPKPKVPPTTGATTPDPQAVSAKVASNPSQPAVSAVNQPGGAKRMQSITKKLADDGMQTARNLASGNARAMGIAGAAALLGIGAYSIRDKSQEDMQRKLNRQRYGEM